MILVVGGRGAGKRAFVEKQLGYAPRQISDDPAEETPVLYALEALEPLPPLEALLRREVVVCQEVGCGVVPMDRRERDRREANALVTDFLTNVSWVIDGNYLSDFSAARRFLEAD